VGKANKQPDQIIEVIVGKTDKLEIKIKDQTTGITLKDLASVVKQAQTSSNAVSSGSSAVVISADRNVKYETVVKVMDTLQRAGIQRVGLSVQLAP
jgi:biopolymer transport protein TolR